MSLEIIAAIRSVKALNEMVKTAHGLKNFNEFVAAISKINVKLMDAQSAVLLAQQKQFSLTKRISELEKEIRDLKNWDSDAKRYQLSEVSSGVFAYVLKPGMEFGEPPHMLWANCFFNGKKGIFQFRGDYGSVKEYVCHSCHIHIDVQRR